MTPNQALRAVVKELGGIRATARACDVAPTSVRDWLRTRVPAERCRQLEHLVDGLIGREQLRPDIYEP